MTTCGSRQKVEGRQRKSRKTSHSETPADLQPGECVLSSGTGSETKIQQTSLFGWPDRSLGRLGLAKDPRCMYVCVCVSVDSYVQLPVLQWSLWTETHFERTPSYRWPRVFCPYFLGTPIWSKVGKNKWCLCVILSKEKNACFLSLIEKSLLNSPIKSLCLFSKIPQCYRFSHSCSLGLNFWAVV